MMSNRTDLSASRRDFVKGAGSALIAPATGLGSPHTVLARRKAIKHTDDRDGPGTLHSAVPVTDRI